jgi:hypothetical protein
MGLATLSFRKSDFRNVTDFLPIRKVKVFVPLWVKTERVI